MNAPVDSALLANASLEDKYTLERGRVFLTGIQAIARLAMLQRVRDERAGLNTAGYISGYRGSPLGGVDQTLARARAHDARRPADAQPLAVAHDDELVERPAIVAGAGVAQRGVAQRVEPVPALPRPLALGLFLGFLHSFPFLRRLLAGEDPFADQESQEQ